MQKIFFLNQVHSVTSKITVTGTYEAPLYAGYDMLAQNFYIKYEGDLISTSSDENYKLSLFS
jgi:hypothetical protein